MKKGFSMLELMVVVIIVGILATLALTSYSGHVEKGRTSEARNTLMQVRTAYNNYMLEHRNGPADLEALGFTAEEVPPECQNTHYFAYSFDNKQSIATRCIADGKEPNAKKTYQIMLNHTRGTWAEVK